jgi:hypothetical protein
MEVEKGGEQSQCKLALVYVGCTDVTSALRSLNSIKASRVKASYPALLGNPPPSSDDTNSTPHASLSIKASLPPSLLLLVVQYPASPMHLRHLPPNVKQHRVLHHDEQTPAHQTPTPFLLQQAFSRDTTISAEQA